MKNRLEIIFWKIARRIIIKGYGADCPDYDSHCASCKAGKMVGWINEHIELLEFFC